MTLALDCGKISKDNLENAFEMAIRDDRYDERLTAKNLAEIDPDDLDSLNQ